LIGLCWRIENLSGASRTCYTGNDLLTGLVVSALALPEADFTSMFPQQAHTHVLLFRPAGGKIVVNKGALNEKVTNDCSTAKLDIPPDRSALQFCMPDQHIAFPRVEIRGL
jgi:hypothetical protein